MRSLPLSVWFTLVMTSLCSHCGEDSPDLCLRKCCPNHQAMFRGRCVNFTLTQFTMDLYREAHVRTFGDLSSIPFVRVKINLGLPGNHTKKKRTQEERHKRETIKRKDDISTREFNGTRNDEPRRDEFVDNTTSISAVIKFFDKFLARENITATTDELDAIRTALIINKGQLNLNNTERGELLDFLGILASRNRLNNNKKDRYFIVNLESSRSLIEGLKFRNVLEKIHRHGLLKSEVGGGATKQGFYRSGGIMTMNGRHAEEVYNREMQDLTLPASTQTSIGEETEISVNNANTLDTKNESSFKQLRDEGEKKTANPKDIVGFFDKFLANENITATPADVNLIRTAVIMNKIIINLDDQEIGLLLEFLALLSSKGRLSEGKNDRFFLLNLDSSKTLIENLKLQNVLDKIRKHGLLKDEMVSNNMTRDSNRTDIKPQSNASSSEENEIDDYDVNTYIRQALHKTIRTHVHNVHTRDKSTISPPINENEPRNQMLLKTPPPKDGPPKLYLSHGKECDVEVLRLEPENSANDTYFVLDNGDLFYPYVQKTFSTAPEGYCLEYFIEDDHVMPLLCIHDNQEEPEIEALPEFQILYVLGMSTSIGFLGFTFIVYALVPELRNLHGCCLMCHIFSLIMAYWCLVMMLAVLPHYQHDIPVEICVTFGFLIQFFFLATFFWLNVMCFDIWWTFSSTLRPIHGTIPQQEKRKFLLYSLYAWCFPCVVVGATILQDTLDHSWIKPGFGEKKCWFTSDLATLVYFYGPVGLLILCNTLMFLGTARTMLAHHRTNTTILTTRGSKRHMASETERFNLYLKLFTVMGVNWIMEVISWVCGGPEYIWYVSDMGNALQGLLIFLIFVCKRRILSLLILRVYPQCSWQYVRQNSNSSGTSGNTARTVETMKL